MSASPTIYLKLVFKGHSLPKLKVMWAQRRFPGDKPTEVGIAYFSQHVATLVVDALRNDPTVHLELDDPEELLTASRTRLKQLRTTQPRP